MYTKEEVLDFVNEENVKFVRLAFFALDGTQKNISIMAGELPRAFEHGVSFDASSIKGFQPTEKSGLVLNPDPTTLAVLPWRPSNGKVVRMFCDITYPDGSTYEKDCRHILKKSIEKAEKEYGIELMFGSEIEFYLLNLGNHGEKTNIPFDDAGYMDIAPKDKGENIRRDICFTLEEMGIMPETSHHETGPGQNEIDFHYGNALVSADNTSTFKWIVRTKAATNGLYADFSPSPLKNKPSSVMHITISCHNKKNDTDYIQNILAGILYYLKDITLFLHPLTSSYKNLRIHKFLSNIEWDYNTSSKTICIPQDEFGKRLELRTADSDCNPYIVFTLLIEAALYGIKNNLMPCDSTTKKSIFNKLPSSLSKAIKQAESSTFVNKILGKDLLTSFIHCCKRGA